MAAWTQKIDIHGVIGRADKKYDLSRLEEDCPEEVKADLAAEVEKCCLWRFAPRLREARSIAEVNRILEAVFNAADRERVWCGLPSFA